MRKHLIKDSAIHKGIRDAARDAKKNVQALREMFWLLNAHADLIALPRAAEILLEICRLIPEHWGDPLSDHGLDRWPDLLDWIVENRAALARTLNSEQFDKRSEKNDDHPIDGHGIKRFAMYGALYNSAQRPEDREIYRLLQAHLLVSHVRCISIYSTVEDYEDQTDEAFEWQPMPNSIYRPAYALRSLSSGEFHDYLQTLPVRLAPMDFSVAMADLELASRNSLLIKFHRDLQYFFEKVWGERAWRERSGGSGKKGGHSQIAHTPVSGFVEINSEFVQTENLLGDPDDPGSDWGQQTVVSVRRHNRKAQRELLESDLDPDEFDDETELVMTGYGEDGSAGGLAGLVGPAHGQIKHISMASQLLPWSPQQLTIEEVADTLLFLERTRDIILAKPTPTPTDCGTLEDIALLQTVIWTASPLERARTLRLLSSNDSRAVVELGLESECTESASATWIFRSLVPPYQLAKEPVPELERERTPIMELPDRVGTINAIRDVMRTRPSPTDPATAGRVFPKKLDFYRKRIDQLLKKLDPTGRITAVKLSHVLFDGLACATQNVTQTMSTYGRIHALGRVRLFYSTSYVDLLQEAYTRQVDELIAELAKAEWSAGSVRTQPPEKKTLSVGSRACPKFDAVRKAVQNLRGRIEDCSQPRSNSEIALYHKYYTLYSIWDAAFATARRAVVTPYLDARRIDPVTGIGTLVEKDDGRGYRTRMVWLPPSQLTQLKFFASHMNRIRHLMGLNSLDEPVALITEDLKPIQIRPKHLEELMSEFLPFQANVQRRFMRMQLLDRGCAPEVVDAWMGHWGRGEEPWGEMSTLSFAQCISELRKHLVPTLDELGFAPTAGALK